MNAKRIVTIALLAAAAALILTGCPPQPPCDEKIKDKQSIEEAVRADLANRQFDTAFTELQLNISDCYVNDVVGITVSYRLPAEFSNFSIVYRDFFILVYGKTGSIDLGKGWDNPAAYDLVSVTEFFKGHINKIENNPRIKEFLEKTGPSKYTHDTHISMSPSFSRDGSNSAQYNFKTDSTFTYQLSNNIDWQEYPEIGLAQRAIEENLLVGPLASCSIGHGDAHAFTSARADSAEGPWYMTVALECEDGWKDAYVQINQDGTFERLGLKLK